MSISTNQAAPSGKVSRRDPAHWLQEAARCSSTCHSTPIRQQLTGKASIKNSRVHKALQSQTLPSGAELLQATWIILKNYATAGSSASKHSCQIAVSTIFREPTTALYATE